MTLLRTLAIAILAMLLCLSVFQVIATNTIVPDIDAYAEVVYVVDGDTIDVVVLKVFDTKYIGFLNKKIRIRFADINAPELYTYEGKLAKRFLYNLVYGRYVYLDIDDLYIYGKYGRVIAMVYLPINSTHLLNINLYLVEKGYAVFKDYPNQFNPYTWKLVVSLPLKIIATIRHTTTIPSPTKTSTIKRSHRSVTTSVQSLSGFTLIKLGSIVFKRHILNLGLTACLYGDSVVVARLQIPQDLDSVEVYVYKYRNNSISICEYIFYTLS